MKLQFLVALAASVCTTVLAREPITTKWTIEGAEREALIFPPATSGAEKAPVIFGYHGHGGNMRFAARAMHFQDAWPEALVVYMQGLPTPSLFPDREKGLRPGWQHHPGELNNRDLKFFDAVLATLREKYSVDDRRIFATGFSNGGFFTYLLWAERPNIFAAFAPGASLILPSVHLTQPHPALHYAGQRDQLVKFKDQERTIEEVRRLDHCAPRADQCGTFCSLYQSATGTSVETFVHPAGHIYPLPVTDLIVKFFREHPRSP